MPPVATSGTTDVSGAGAADHGRRLRPAGGHARRPAGSVRHDVGHRCARRSSAQRNGVAAAPHQAQHPQGRRRRSSRVVERDGDDRPAVRSSAARWIRRRAWRRRSSPTCRSPAKSTPHDRRVRTGELFSGELLPRGVAYMAIGAPTPAGDWSVRAAMSQGDLSSWIVAGAFQSRERTRRTSTASATRTARRSISAAIPRRSLAATDGSRNVGELYGARSVGDLPRRSRSNTAAATATTTTCGPGGLFSPRVGVTIEPLQAHARVRDSSRSAWSRRAPRSSSRAKRPGRGCRPSGRSRRSAGPAPRAPSASSARATSTCCIEHEFDDNYVLGVRRFYQNVDNQLVTLFGLRAGRPAVGRPLLRRQRRLARRRWLGVPSQQHRASASAARSTTA